MKSCSVYESEDIRRITGDTLRPGDFFLTDRAVKICGFQTEDKVLDVGCGMGATMEMLSSRYHYDMFGIDPSIKLLQSGKKKYHLQQTLSGRGEELPFSKSYFKGVMAECSMSLMENYQKCIMESFRILEKNGFFIISDVYARSPQHLKELQQHPVNSCMRGLFDVEELKEAVMNAGFELITFEDWSELLKQLMVKIIFQYGSMSVFWETATCSSCGDFQQKLAQCRPGYFLLIAKKV